MGEIANVIGGGLAGVEAASQAAECGVQVRLYEMRPVLQTPAHRTCKPLTEVDPPISCLNPFLWRDKLAAI